METWMERGVDTMFLCFIKSEVLFMGITSFYHVYRQRCRLRRIRCRIGGCYKKTLFGRIKKVSRVSYFSVKKFFLEILFAILSVRSRWKEFSFFFFFPYMTQYSETRIATYLEIRSPPRARRLQTERVSRRQQAVYFIFKQQKNANATSHPLSTRPCI